ncbi:MAG TPA: SO2930 family diheme c-type cytochrome [Polyangiaceae bacterium]
MKSVGILASVVVLAATVASCSSSSSSTANGPCKPSGDGTYVDGLYDTLDKYCMVSVQDGAITTSETPSATPTIVEYELNTPLFSDYALKVRTVWMPPGTQAQYKDDGVFDFPVGTIFTKSFGFPKDFRDASSPVTWVETRILARGKNGWEALSYLWDDAQKTATQKPGGTVRPIDFVDASGNAQHASYLVPSQNQCPKCHNDIDVLGPIGPHATELNRDHAYFDGSANQLTKWTALGTLAGAPDPSTAPKLAPWDDTSATTEARARSYLDANCSYCHSEGGEARTTGLFLLASETDQGHLGICKTPVAAGRATAGLLYDIVPGHPEQSILVDRMKSTEPSIAMPEIGRSLVHAEAVSLIQDWITAMPGGCP